MSLLAITSVYVSVQITKYQTDQFSSGLGGGLSTPGPPAQSYVTQYWRIDKSIDDEQVMVNTDSFQFATLLESRTTVEGGTTGLRTWLASQVLAQYLISHPGNTLS
jgi:hypothetical protein